MTDDNREQETRREIPGPRPSSPPSRSQPDTAFDPAGERFELGEELGRGGMGRVLAATDRALAREVAIKQALTDDEVDLARFEREVRITARLEHPAIVPIHDAGRDRNGRPFYVMRRLDGEHLSDRVAAATTPRERLALVPHVLAAVDAAAFAHARKIIHRDIKPWNILVGSYGETLLIDWGLARELDEADLPPSGRTDPRDTALTRAGNVFGTPGYMAPEQARGELADERADVYALGATLFHVLTGESVLGESSATAWLDRVAEGAAVPQARLPPEVPRELIAIVAKAMAESRSARYRDAGELAADLRAFLAGQLVAAHHYTRRERAARFVRKHRLALSIAGAAIAAVAIVATISIRNVIDERDLARAAREEAEAQRAAAAQALTLATDRSEVILLDRASALTSIDPTRAVALVRQLPASSRHLRRARDIAETASFRGISRGLATNLDNINSLLFTSDNKTLIASGDRGDVWVIDLLTGAHRIHKVGSRTAVTLLLGDTELVFAGFDVGLFALDLRTGLVSTIDPKATPSALWRVDGTRYRYLDSTRRAVVERTRGEFGERILATDVKGALSFGEHLVVGNGKQVRLIESGRTIEVAASEAYSDVTIAAASPEGDRFVIASTQHVAEWDLAGKQLRTWNVIQTASFVFTDNHFLYAATSTGRLMMLTAEGSVELGRYQSAIWWQSAVPRGAAFLDPDGHLYQLSGLHVQQFPFDYPRSRTLGVSPDGRWLAIGSVEGTIRWIDLALMRPPMYSIPPNAQGCWADDQIIILVGNGELLELSRKTGVTRSLATFPEGLPFSCSGRLGNAIVLASALGTMFVDMVRKQSWIVEWVGFVDTLAGRFVYPRARELVDQVPDTRTDKVLLTATDNIELFASRGRWAVATTKPDRIYRVDRQTGAIVSTRVPNIEMVAIRLDGAVAIVQRGVLSLWNGTSLTKQLELPPGEVATLLQVDEAWGVRLADGSLWYASPSGVVQRTPTNRVNFIGVGPQDLVWRVAPYQRLFRMHMESGEQLVLDLPLKLLMHADDQRAIGTGNGFVVLLESRLPVEPAKLFDWIDHATNAYLDATAALRWRGDVTR